MPLQLVAMLFDCIPYTRSVCSHPRMTPPVLHPVLHRAAQALSLASRGLHPVVPPVPSSTGRDPAADCHAVLAFLQMAGFMLAAVFKARQEARLWVQHQAQRRALGLPLEAGWHASVYGAVLAVAGVSQPAAAPLLSLAMLLIGWQALMVLGGGASSSGGGAASALQSSAAVGS